MQEYLRFAMILFKIVVSSVAEISMSYREKYASVALLFKKDTFLLHKSSLLTAPASFTNMPLNPESTSSSETVS